MLPSCSSPAFAPKAALVVALFLSVGLYRNAYGLDSPLAEGASGHFKHALMRDKDFSGASRHTHTRELYALANAEICAVYPDTAAVDCSVLHPESPFAACCDMYYCTISTSGSSEDDVCPHLTAPGCCPALHRAKQYCAPPDARTRTCNQAGYPVPACCERDYCYTNPDGSSVHCKTDETPGCCAL